MPDPPRIKFCGLTRPEDARAAAETGAWAVGVVLSPVGPRALEPPRAAAVMDAVPAGVARVGVFVDPDAAAVVRAVAALRLTHVQVHGRADVMTLRRLTGLPVVEAVAMTGPRAVAAAVASRADLVLLDAGVPGRHGGTGTPFDWDLLVREPLDRPFALAGGLTPESVGAAIVRLRPTIVDVSSGVESAPGIKDPDLMRAFARAVAAARAPDVAA